MATRVISLDVECAATGKGHDDRSPCWIGVVARDGSVLLDVVVNVEGMVSPLTSVTGLSSDDIRGGVPLRQAITSVRNILGPDVLIVGQSVLGDIEWLGLRKGEDYADYMDSSELFKVWNGKYSNWMYFSLAKLAFGLLGKNMHMGGHHSPVEDAKISMQIYNNFMCPGKERALEAAKQTLHSLTIKRQFPPQLMSATRGDRNIDSVCGYAFDPAKCACGQPTKRDTDKGGTYNGATVGI